MLCSNLLIFILLQLLVTVSFILTGSLFEKQEESIAKSEEFEEEYGSYDYYWTCEGMNDADYYSFLYGDETGAWYDKLASLEQSLWNESRFQFYTCNPQIIQVEEKKSDIFLEGYENGDGETAERLIDDKKSYAIKSLIVSNNFFNSTKVKLQEGRIFLEDDYIYDSQKNIPVILGKAYSQYYSIGDTFECVWLGQTLTLEVVGLLDKDSFYLSSANNDFVSAERYVIMPSLKIEEKSEFSRIVSLMGLNGTIKSNLGENETNEIVDQLYKEQGLLWGFNIRNPESSFDGQSTVKQYGKMTKQISAQFKLLVVLVVIFTMIALLLNIFSILQRNKYNFGVELLCGAGFKDILFEGAGVAAFILLVGDLWASIVLIAIQDNWSCLILLQIIVLIILFISIISCYFYMKKMQIGDIIGGCE